MLYASRRDVRRPASKLVLLAALVVALALAAAAQEAPDPSPGCGSSHPKPDVRMLTLAEAPPAAANDDVVGVLTAHAGLVLIARAVRVTPRLSGGPWHPGAFQEVRLAVARTVKISPTIRPPSGQPTVWAYGGTAMRGGRCIEWVGPGENLKAGRNYLLFANYDARSRRLYATSWYEIFRGGDLRSMPEVRGDRAVNQLSLPQVLKRVASEIAIEDGAER